MTSHDNDPRVGALQDLVRLRRSVPDAAAALAAFDWDSDEELVTLTRADAARLLTAYLDGTLTDADVVTWAEALEGRDDVGFEPSHDDTLKNLLFDLSTPELTEPLTPDNVRRRLIQLTQHKLEPEER